MLQSHILVDLLPVRAVVPIVVIATKLLVAGGAARV